MPAISRLGAAIVSQEDLKSELTPVPSLFDIWKGVLLGVLNSTKIIAEQRQRIRQLESGLRDASRTISDLEQVIMIHGESDDSPKTLRHRLLKIVDEKFHQKTKFLV